MQTFSILTILCAIAVYYCSSASPLKTKTVKYVKNGNRNNGNNFAIATNESNTKIYVGTYDVLIISDNDGQKYFETDTDRNVIQDVTKVFVTDKKIYILAQTDTIPAMYVQIDDGQYDDNKPWEKVYVGDYLRASSLYVSHDDAKIYAATPDGLGISVDGGKTWTFKKTTDGLGQNSVNSVYVVDKNVYAGTYGSGVSISTDGGNTWKVVKNDQGLANDSVNDVFALDDSVYVGTEQGLSISKDHGQTWVTKNASTGFGDAGHEDVCQVVATKTHIYAVLNCKHPLRSPPSLYISADDGKTWDAKTQIDVLSTLGTSLFALDDEVFVGGRRTFAISRDSGKTWDNYDGATSSIFAKHG